MPHPPPPRPVPSGLLRNDTAYRSVGPRREGRIGAGFLIKPGRIIDLPRHRPPYYSAVWCLRGSGTYIDQDGAAWPMGAGSLFHRFPDRIHHTVFTPGCDWAECFIALSSTLALGLMEIGVLDPRRPVQHPGLDVGLITELSELVDSVRTMPERDLPRLTARLIGVLASLCTRDSQGSGDPQRELVDHACRRLTENPRLDLARLARELDMSYERFRKIFREGVGISPGEYRIRRRIDRARTALQSPGVAVKAVAEELGYPNPYAFSAQFKQLVGESPEAYRRRETGTPAVSVAD